MIKKFLLPLLKKTLGLQVIVYYFCAVAAECQTLPNPDLPTEPFVNSAKDPSEWTITLTYSGSSPSPTPGQENQAPLVKQIKVVKAGIYRRETSFWSNGTESENWYVGNVFIEHQPTWPAGYLNARLLGGKQTDDFLLAWVNLSYFKHKEDLQGHSCYLYEVSDSVLNPGLGISKEMEAKVNDPSLPADARNTLKLQIAEAQKLGASTTKVWIDKTTRLPVQIEGEGLTKQFEFSKEVPKLQFPPEYQKQLDLLKKMYPNAVGNVP